MKLVPDWRRAWRWFSMQAMAVSAALQAAWLGLPPDLKSRLPVEWLPALAIAVLVLGAVGRVIDQGQQK